MPRRAREPSLEEPEEEPEAKACRLLSTDRVARRWAAVTLKLLGGWSINKIRKEIKGVTSPSICAWTRQLAADGELSDGPRPRDRKVSSQDVAAIQGELTQRQGPLRGSTSLRRAVPRAITKRAATKASRQTYARALADVGWAEQAVRKALPLAGKAGKRKREKRVTFVRGRARSAASNHLFTDSAIFTSDPTYKSNLGRAWGPRGDPPDQDVTQAPRWKVHAYAGITRFGATPLLEVTGTSVAATRPRGRPRKPAAAPANAPAAAPAPAAATAAATAEDHRGVTAHEYRTKVLPHLLSHGKSLFESNGCGRWVFQHDGARIHTTKDTPKGRPTRQVIENITSVLDEWPPSSPDLSPIERLWATAKGKLEQKDWDSLASFKAAVHEAWAEAATPRACASIMGGLRRTWELCARNGGVQVDGWGKGAKARVKQQNDN